MAFAKAESDFGLVRREGVISSDPCCSRTRLATEAPNLVPSVGENRKPLLSPPSSTAKRGCGKWANRVANFFAASASHSGVTLCTAPHVVITFGALKAS